MALFGFLVLQGRIIVFCFGALLLGNFTNLGCFALQNAFINHELLLRM